MFGKAKCYISQFTLISLGFPAYLQPSAKLNISGECILQVTPESIYILDARSPTIKLVTWPLASLRRYGYDSNRFTFEAGRYVYLGFFMARPHSSVTFFINILGKISYSVLIACSSQEQIITLLYCSIDVFPPPKLYH